MSKDLHISDEQKIAKKAAYEKEWHRKNPDKNKETRRRFYQRHKEEIKEQNKVLYYANVEHTREQKRLWRQGRKERLK